jgi:hypothetical protein
MKRPARTNNVLTNVTARLLGTAALLGAVYVLFKSLPEMVRYFRIRRM